MDEAALCLFAGQAEAPRCDRPAGGRDLDDRRGGRDRHPDADLGPYEDAWDRLRAAEGEGRLPRTVNFITGPSRTGDIEQTIQMGAHGPRRLHVILVEDESQA